MIVWFVDEMDDDWDRETFAVCTSKEVAEAVVEKKKEANAEFAKQYGFMPKRDYDVYEVKVLDSADSL